jgi:hypothetical protein
MRAKSPTIALSIEILYILTIDSCRFPSDFRSIQASTLVILLTVNISPDFLRRRKLSFEGIIPVLIYSIHEIARGEAMDLF